MAETLVLGADLEGLAAAATLAQAGRSVRVLAAGRPVGGLAARFPLGAEHSLPGLANETSLVRRPLVAGLGLAEHGLGWGAENPALHVVTGGEVRARITPDALSVDADRAVHTERCAFLARLAGFVEGVLDDPPPEARDPSIGELFDLAKKGFRLRSLGNADMRELMRIVTMPAWDWTAEAYTSDAVRAGLIAPVLSGTVLGPRAAGTTALMLLAASARGAEPEGGLAALADALVRRCEALGVRLDTERGPRSVELDGPRVRALGCTDGERLECDAILSTLDPQLTLLQLVPAGVLTQGLETELVGWRRRGSSAIHALALKHAPGPLVDPELARIVTADSPLVLERAADALKYGELPAPPWHDVRVWRGAPHAPSDGLTLACHLHGVPYSLAGGWTAEARERLRTASLAALEAAFPGLEEAVVVDELLSPPDLEERFGLAGGHLAGGELALDQLWLQRPALALSRYRTPLEGLLLAGASSHPGGFFACGAGILGARAALRN